MACGEWKLLEIVQMDKVAVNHTQDAAKDFLPASQGLLMPVLDLKKVRNDVVYSVDIQEGFQVCQE